MKSKCFIGLLIVTVCQSFFVLALADEPPVHNVLESLEKFGENFHIEGTLLITENLGNDKSTSTIDIAMKRFLKHCCIKIRRETTTGTGNSIENREFVDRVNDHGDLERLTLFMSENQEKWPFVSEGVRIEFVSHALPSEAEAPWTSVWSGLGVFARFCDAANSFFPEREFLAPDALGSDRPKKFTLTKRLVAPDKWIFEAESPRFGNIRSTIERVGSLWRLTEIDHAATIGQATGIDPDGIDVLVELPKETIAQSQKVSDRYRNLMTQMYSDDHLELTSTVWEVGTPLSSPTVERFKASLVKLGQETVESVRQFSTPLPEGKMVLVAEPERQRVGWIVKDGLVVMDKGSLQKPSDTTFVRNQKRLRLGFLVISIFVLLAFAAYSFLRRRGN